jgi:hypothetical protein
MDSEPDRIDDEIVAVLAALRKLMTKVSSPVVHCCLEEAHNDIAHLAEKDIDPMGDLFPAEAA